MSSLPPTFKRIVFGDFIAYLRQSGFTISTAHYLRLQQLLNEFKSDCSPEDLKTLLCPIFATSRDQQESFYRAFDDFFSIFASSARPPVYKKFSSSAPRLEPPSRVRPLRAIRWLLPTLLAVCVVIALISPIDVARKLLWPSVTPGEVGNAAEQDLQEDGIPQTREETGKAARERISWMAAGISSSADRPSQNQSYIDVEAPPLAGTTQFNVADLRYEDFYQRYGEAIRRSAIAAPLILFLIYEVRRLRRSSLILQRQQVKRHLSVWPVQIPETKLGIYNSEHFYQTARSLRRRHFSQARKFDIAATIGATVNSLGYLNVKYETGTTAPEYLFLIDRRSPRDHQARLFTVLSRKLEAEGVYVEIYHFDTDPRVCFHEASGRAVQLDDLFHKHSGHSLILFTDAEGLINPISGKLKRWTSIFRGWRVRTILAPASLTQWAVRELSAAGEFSVLPHTLTGVKALADGLGDNYQHGDSGLTPDWATTYPVIDIADAERNVEEFLLYLGEDVFKWFCACAVYPELHWDLTLFLASLPFMSEGVVTEENLLRLVSLPYFHSGIMPDDLRLRLMRELKADEELSIRQGIIGILEKNAPPDETFAADNYRLNLVVQRWFVRPNFRRWLNARRVARGVTQTQVLQDITLLKFVESTSPLAFILPRRLYGVFFYRGFPALGLRTLISFSICLAFVLLAWLGLKRVAPAPTYLKIEQLLVGHSGTITALAFAPAGKMLASVASDNQIILWEAESDRWRPVRYIYDAAPGTSMVTFSSDGRLIAASGGSGGVLNKISVWDTGDASLLWQAEVAPPIKAITFSPSGSWLAIAHQDKWVTLLGPATGDLIMRFASTIGQLSSITVSPDSSTLCGGSPATKFSFLKGWEPDIILWNPFTKQVKGSISSGEGVCSVTITPDSNTLITGGNKGRVQLWDIKSGNNLANFDTTAAQVCFVASSSDGGMIAGIDQNKTLRIWGAKAADLRLDYQLRQTERVAPALSFSSEGDVVLAEWGQDNSVHVVRLREKNLASSSRTGAPERPTESPAQEIAVVHTEQGRFIWVNNNGDVVRAIVPADSVSSFFIHGLKDTQDEAMRAENLVRMQTYSELLKTWGNRGINGRVSEVFLDDLRDVRVHLAGDEAGIEVRLGDKDFGPRLERALRVIDDNQRFFKINYVDATSDTKLKIGYYRTDQSSRRR